MEAPSARPSGRKVAEPPLALTGLRVMMVDMAPPAETPHGILELLAWWKAKSGRGLPERAAIDPVEFRRHLSRLALLDVEDGDFRFRLAGEELQARYGSLRGRSVGGSLFGIAREETLAEHRACAAGRLPTLAQRVEPTTDSTDQRRYWRLLLPFGEGNRTTVILAMLHFEKARRL